MHVHVAAVVWAYVAAFVQLSDEHNTLKRVVELSSSSSSSGSRSKRPCI
jgi:hypothetical protein